MGKITQVFKGFVQGSVDGDMLFQRDHDVASLLGIPAENHGKTDVMTGSFPKNMGMKYQNATGLTKSSPFSVMFLVVFCRRHDKVFNIFLILGYRCCPV
jgi:hypothetical protein